MVHTDNYIRKRLSESGWSVSCKKTHVVREYRNGQVIGSFKDGIGSNKAVRELINRVTSVGDITWNPSRKHEVEGGWLR